jgi:sugar (pentulose or hexulose) kinase
MENCKKNWAYLNCGTWGMVGLISNYPVVTKEGFLNRFGNEGGVGNYYHFLKNMVCLWIIQQCRKKWNEEQKRVISWKEIDSLTENTPDRNIFIDVDDEVFEREIFNMPQCIISYCKGKNQDAPGNIGEICRMFFESLALKYLLNLKKLEMISGKKMELLHMVGGGSNNKLLCQWISDASGLSLIAGPPETTTAGNLLAQLVAVKEIENIDEAKEIMINSVELAYYYPKKNMYGVWNQKFTKYLEILSLDV